MSAAPGQMMMAWVWISLVTLARLNTAEEPHWDADGGSAGLEALYSDSEPQEKTRSGGRSFPVPVWKFLKVSQLAGGGDASDFGRPQCRCSGRTLSVRFSLIRHSDLRLEDGRRLLSLPDGCRGSARTFGPWLLLKLPYTSCHMALWISNGTWFRQLKLHYFDHLLQANVTGVAACENPATSLRMLPPLATCRATDVTVKLPPGTSLKRVKALGKDGVVGRALTTTTPGAVYVQLSTPVNVDSIFEIIYFDSAGEMSTMLVACFNAVTQSGRDRHPRALEEPDLWELWDFDEVPLDPFIPDPLIPEPTDPLIPDPFIPEPTDPFIPEPTDPFIPEPTDPFIPDPFIPETTDTPVDEDSATVTTVTTTVTTQVTYADAEIFELWGFDEIPDGPYTGDQTTTASTATSTSSTTSVGTMTTTSSTITMSAAPTTSATSAAPTTTMTSAITTTTTTSAAPTTTMTSAITTTTTTSAAPTTMTSAITTTTTTSAAPTTMTSAITTTTTTNAAPTTTSSTPTTSAAPTTTSSSTPTSAASSITSTT